MHRFVELAEELRAGRDFAAVRERMVRWFAQAGDEDAAWGLALLGGAAGVPRLVGAREALANWPAAACAAAGIEPWLFQAARKHSGDLAETVAFVLPLPPVPRRPGLAAAIRQIQLALGMPRPGQEAPRAAALIGALADLEPATRLALLQLALGRPRLKLHAAWLQQAVAEARGADARLLAERLSAWLASRQPPSAARWRALLATPGTAPRSQIGPWPFSQPRAERTNEFPLRTAPLFACASARGLPAQLWRGADEVVIWGHDDAGARRVDVVLPRLAQAATLLPPGTALEGELVLRCKGMPPVHDAAGLERRLAARPGSARRGGGRDAEVRFIVQDLVQDVVQDLVQGMAQSLQHVPGPGAVQRTEPRPEQRHRQLARQWRDEPGLASALPLAPAAVVHDAGQAHALLATCQADGYQALWLRPQAGDGWWWQPPARRLRAALVHLEARMEAASGEAWRCTFALPADRRVGAPWLPVARLAGAALPLAESDEALLRDATLRFALERFGPTHSLRPALVAEIAYEAVQASRRHKAGFVLRGARLARLLPGAAPDDLPTVDELRAGDNVRSRPG
jgi:DNA ligase-1